MTTTDTSVRVTSIPGFRPMLAETPTPDELASHMRSGTLLASWKLDGIRATILKEGVLSRSLKPIRNRHIQSSLHREELIGFDGELIVGDMFSPNVFQTTTSGVMTADGTPTFQFWVFDLVGYPFPYQARYDELRFRIDRLHNLSGNYANINLLPQTHVTRPEDLEEKYEDALQRGCEGLILRRLDAPYKFNRSTAKQGYLLKAKPWADSEAEILDVRELYRNQNQPIRDSLGLQRRGTSKEGMVPAGVMGEILVRDLKNPQWEFCIGSGFDFTLRQQMWIVAAKQIGRIVKYKYLPHGMVDVPRHPVFMGFRHKEDM